MMLAVVALTACSRTKEKALSDFEALYSQTSAKCDNYSVSDWKKYEKDLKEIEADLDKFEYTSAERITIGKLKVKHAALSLKGKAKVAGESVKDAAKEVSDIVKDAAEDAAEAVNSISK